MKKVLFATTALVATAGVAAADVAITGGAEMGVVGGDDAITTFHQSVDVRFTMSGEADGGLQFGARIDLDDLVDTGADPVDVQGDFADFIVFISGEFGTLTMGDTDGAFDAAMQEVNVGSPGSINDDETAHAGYSGNSGLDGVFNGQVLSYSYSISGFTIIGSLEIDGDNAEDGPFGTPSIVGGDGLEGDPVFGIGASYEGAFAGGSYTIGAGYQVSMDTHASLVGDQELSIIGISGVVELDNGLSAGLNFSQIDYDLDGVATDFSGQHAAIGVSYTFDAITVHANYGMFDWDDDAFVEDSEGFGLAAAYDLGGGLSAHIGYGHSDIGNANNVALGTADPQSDDSTWSLGLAMSF